MFAVACETLSCADNVVERTFANSSNARFRVVDASIVIAVQVQKGGVEWRGRIEVFVFLNKFAVKNIAPTNT